MSYALLFPLQPQHPEQVVPFAEVVNRGQAGRLWMGQSFGVESHQMFAYLAGRGYKVPTGLGVTLMPLRHPMEAAGQARSVATLTGRPVVAGYGAATPEMVRSLRGRPYTKPATAAAGYAGAVRGMLGKGVSGHDCEACVATGQLPKMNHPTVEVGLGVLRPGMARAAGGVADVAVTWMTPPAYIKDTLIPALTEGAAGGKVPRVATVVHAGLAGPGRDPVRLLLSVARGHLGSHHYTDMLRRAAVPADSSDPGAGARAMVEAGVYAYGTLDEVVARLRAYRDAGVDEVIVNTGGVGAIEGLKAGLADAEQILAGLADADD
ncbi:LLM class flavin-dependent oxidoreductase [Herbidospora mongoliensis]|uniref:LLM class flavin-dependent oxidoreductase n=1 Tax=Herbidospora mongoliensis TaxID=688067 RepID=UPI000837A8A0|nr:LLM class flavin-dependent oxidoreductase [Herbidospora mongoliensis]